MRSALLFGAALALILLIPTQVTSAQDALSWETLEELCGTNYSSYEPALEFYGPMQFLEIPDVVIAYYRFGNASTELPPIVLVVGFSGTMKDWPITILSDLAEDREVIIFDNRGQGSSRDTSPDMPLSILSMADDTKNFVEALDLARPPHLFGWSMGGMITLKAAAMFADSFDRFAVFSGGPGSLRSQLPSLEILEKFLLDDTMTEVYRLGTLFPLNTTSGVEAACKYAEEMQYTPADTIRKLATRRQLEALIEYYFSDTTLDALASTQQHILVVGGLWDPVVPAINQKLVGQVLPSAWMAIFEDGAHGAFMQHWDTVRELLKVFLHREESELLRG